MFTGIVQGRALVAQIDQKPGLTRLVLDLPPGLERELAVGASVSVAGVCLTVVARSGREASFDAMNETLLRTNLGALRVGGFVNVERSARAHDEIGGHLVSGHVRGTADVVGIECPENNCVMTFRVPLDDLRFLFHKGFVALDGVSLTVSAVDRAAGTFSVWFIPETLRATTFGERVVGERVNLEVDARTQTIVETVEALLPELLARSPRAP